MTKKKSIKIDNSEKLEHNFDEDVVFEDDSVGVSDKIKKVQKKLKECEKERQEYLNGWQRARADSVNREKETALEREKAISRTKTNIFIDLFPILDSFDMAFSHKEAWEKVDENWRIGIEQIYIQTIQVFEQAGITPIDIAKDTEGEKKEEFDPRIHEQVQTEEVAKKEDDNRVCKIIQKGYRKGDQVLRPAKVIIGKFT